MSNELEIISHRDFACKIFLNELRYRTPHFHTDFEVCLMLKGKLRMISRDTAMDAGCGDLWVLNPFQLHEYESAGGPALVLIIQFAPDFFESYFRQIDDIDFAFTQISIYDPACQNLFHAIMALARLSLSQPEYYELDCAGLLIGILRELLELIPFTSALHRRTENRDKKMRLLRLIAGYVDENYSHKLLLTDVAAKTGLTANYLSHFFKDTVGVSFQQYLAKIRCARALCLLRATRLSLAGISVECGFSDVKYLVKNFKEFYGIHPKEIRGGKSHGMPAEPDYALRGGDDFTVERRLSPAQEKIIIEEFCDDARVSIHNHSPSPSQK